VFAFVLVGGFMLLARKTIEFRDGTLIWGVLCGMCFGLEFLFLFQALDFTTVSRVSILFYTMPFWFAVAAHFLIPGERLTVLRSLGLLLALLGVALALWKNEDPASPLAFLGDIFAIISSMFWAAIALFVRISPLSRSKPEMQLLYQLAVSAIILLIAAPLFGETVREFRPILGFAFAFQIIVVVAIGFSVWLWLMSVYPASKVAAFGFLAPIFGVFFGWLVLGDTLSANILLALVLVASGIALVNTKST
jgi:drug/metabolite transporter (DMT)-like permease